MHITVRLNNQVSLLRLYILAVLEVLINVTYVRTTAVESPRDCCMVPTRHNGRISGTQASPVEGGDFETWLSQIDTYHCVALR